MTSTLIRLSTSLQTLVRSGLEREEGASLVEYALLLALIAVICIGAITLVGNSTSNKLSETASYLK